MEASTKVVLRKTCYIIAACILVLASLVLISRALTPLFDKHLPDFEKLAAKYLQMPVKINKVRVSWQQYQPGLTFNEVTVFSKDKLNDPLVRIQKVKIYFSIPKSLWHLTPVMSSMLISGSDLSVNEAESGEFTVQGFPAFSGFNQTPYQREMKSDDFLSWFTTQPLLMLKDIDLRYNKFNGTKRFVTIYDLTLQNSGQHHAIIGKALLHQDVPTEVTAKVQWLGDGVDPKKLKAKIYLYVSGISLGEWLKGVSVGGWEVKEGLGSAKIWATWNQGVFRKIQSTYQLYALNLYSATDQSTHKISRMSGDVGWKLDGNNQIFAGQDILFDFPNRLWPVTSFYAVFAKDAADKLQPKVVHIGYVNLPDLRAILFSSAITLPENFRTTIENLHLTGDLQNISIAFSGAVNDLSHISFDGNFNRLGFAAWKNIPAMKNLSGLMKWDGEKGSLLLDSRSPQFTDNLIFAAPLNFKQLSGTIDWQRAASTSWLINLSSLQLQNDDLSITVNGAVTIPANNAAITDLTASYNIKNVNHVSRYLPAKIFDPELNEWLTNAFLSGELQAGTAVMRGPVSDYPFDQGTGEITVTGALKNIDFRFAPDWPILNKVNGNIKFSGRQISIVIDNASILGIPLNNLHGNIPYLGDAKPQILTVDGGVIQSDFAKAMQFVHRSPLEKSIGKMFTGVLLEGPMVLKLGLTVPLKNPDDTAVRGEITLNQTLLNLVPWDLKLTELNGLVNFTEDTVTATGLQGKLFAKPLTLDLGTVQKSKNVSVAQATFKSNLAVADLEGWLKLPASDMVKGATDVTGVLDFSLKTPMQINLMTDLVGMELNLPDPYSKKATQAKKFNADITIADGKPPVMILTYDNSLSAALVLERKQNQFALMTANLRLGGGVPTVPTQSGLFITGTVAELNWDKIKSYLGQSNTTSFSGLPLKSVDVTVKKLSLFGQQLTSANLKVAPVKTNYDVDIDSAEVNGHLLVPADFNKNSTVIAQFKKLSLRSNLNGSSEKTPFIDVKSLPAISFDADNLSINDIMLGQLSFQTTPNTNGLTIQSLRLSSAHIDLRSSGSWKQTNSSYVTQIQGTATTPNVSGLLNSFGFDVRNFVSGRGKFTFDLNWADAPFVLSLANMNGKAAIETGAGRIIDIGQSSGAKMDLGRMLNIFSLQSIPRRLSFDFSDLFQKGYSYDSFRGDMNFQNGNLFTTNTRFVGPVASVNIKGRIGLVNKDYDLTMSVTADVTSSLPVAATLLTGQPLIGLAAFAVNKMISPEVSKATTYYYTVRGPWSNPSWNSISEKPRQ